MEMMGPIRGLEALRRPVRVQIVSDSQYVVNGFTTYLERWIRCGWVASNGDPLKNIDLWQRLVTAARPHEVAFKWVRGHASHVGNIRADELAGKQARMAKSFAERDFMLTKGKEFT